jgi:Bacterial Ig domain
MRLLVVAALVALLAAPSALAGPSLKVGAVEDGAVWNNPGAQMDLARLAGFDSVRMTAQWSTNQTSLPRAHLTRLQNAATAAVARGIQPIVSIYNVSSAQTPADDTQRARFVQFVGNTVASLPWVTTFIVGNEPNSNVYWMPQFDSAGGDAAAVAYERLLADAYDAIKAVRPNATVAGGAIHPRGSDDPAGSKPSHSPTTFIRDLGEAYRASGRTTPIMDVLDMHGYADNSSLPPSMPHTSNTIALGDYGKLVAELGKAFDGTAQRGSNLPILYGEFGVESIVPSNLSGAYAGTEPASSGAVDEATQVRYYAEAFKLALCQPNVIGILVFHVVDESALGAWQSGPFYANGTPKSSLGAIRDDAVAARNGTLSACPDKTAPKVSFTGPSADGTITVDATDDTGIGKVELVANGDVQQVKFAAPYMFKWMPRSEGRYDFEVRATDGFGNVGRATTALTAVKDPDWAFGPPPLNDLFSAARTLSSWTGAVLGSTAFAASERGEPLRRSVWYRWKAPTSGALDISAGGARVTVYVGGSIKGLRPIARAGNKVRFTAQRGRTYRIAVLGGGTFLLAWKRG